MLIRSQDKKQLLNLTTMEMLNIQSEVEISKIEMFHSGIRTYIGNYTTEAKAIKVLDMIVSNYDSLNMYHNQPEQGWVFSVFQMPSDEIVKEGAIKDE